MAAQGWTEQLPDLQARLTAQAEAQIHTWYMERMALLQHAIGLVAQVGVEITHHWQGANHPMGEVRTQKDPRGIQDDMARALALITEAREGRDMDQAPAEGRRLEQGDGILAGLTARLEVLARRDGIDQDRRHTQRHGLRH
jgi:hypothetical protein